MKTYSGKIVGLRYEGRADYVSESVHEDDEIVLEREPDNPHDSRAVAAFHDGFHVGYIPRDRRWIQQCLDEGAVLAATVAEIVTDPDGEPRFIAIRIAMVKTPLQAAEEQSMLDNPLVQAFGDELAVLAMLAHADGSYGRRERALIGKYIALRASDEGMVVAAHQLDEALVWARRIGKDDEALLRDGLEGIRPDALRPLWELVELVAEADGRIDPAEAAAIGRVRAAIVDELARLGLMSR